MKVKMAFSEDMQNFVSLIKSGADENIIKKEYISLVKKYHPDRVSDKEKGTYTEYMALLNKVYSQGKTKVREVQIENESNVGNSYFDHLFKVARAEYNHGHDILHAGKDSLEVMQHYWNAIKCYKYIIQHCKDEVIVYSAKFDYQMATDANNTLARTLASAGNELIVKET